ncbi:MAG: hypothetical protein ABEJ31_10575, partial [Haloarculaceae archaeon]
MSLRVLQVVTTRSPFFATQVEALRSQGVDCTVVSVPRPPAAEGSRSVAEYLRFYASVVRRGLGSYDLVHANYGLTGPFGWPSASRRERASENATT